MLVFQCEWEHIGWSPKSYNLSRSQKSHVYPEFQSMLQKPAFSLQHLPEYKKNHWAVQGLQNAEARLCGCSAPRTATSIEVNGFGAIQDVGGERLMGGVSDQKTSLLVEISVFSRDRTYLKTWKNIRQGILNVHIAKLSLHPGPGLSLSQLMTVTPGLVFPKSQSTSLMGARSLCVRMWTRGQRVQCTVPEVDGSHKTHSLEVSALIAN